MIIDDGKVATRLTSRERHFRRLCVLFVAVGDADLVSISQGFNDLGISLESGRVPYVGGVAEALKHHSSDVIVADRRAQEMSRVDFSYPLEPGGIDAPLIVIIDSESDQAEGYIKGRDKRILVFRSSIDQMPAGVVAYLHDSKDAGSAKQGETGVDPDAEERACVGERDGLGTGFVIIEAKSKRALYANRAFEGITGYSEREILRMDSIKALVAPESRETFRRCLREAGGKGTGTSRFAAGIVRRDGKSTELKFAATQFSWNNKKRIAMIVYDSTAATLGTSDKRKDVHLGGASDYHIPFGSIDGIAGEFVVIDIDKQGRVKNWSPGAQRLTGYHEGEIVGAKFISLLVSDDGEAKSKAVSFLDGDVRAEKIDLESWVSQKAGGKIWAGITLTRLFDAMGSTSGFSLLMRPFVEVGVSEAQLREREAQLHSLTSHLQLAREEERTKIARQLHDEFGQMLTALRIDLSILGRMISRTVSEPLGRVSLLEKISSISEVLEHTIKSARRMITELRPPVLDELGLLTAIQWQVLEFENRTGIQCHIKKLQHGVTFDPAVSTAVFRILQQALDNVMRHSAATEVSISLQIVRPNTVLEVADNGKGIEADKLKDPSSTGLIGIRERVLSLGGKLEVHGQPGKGTTLTVSIPSTNYKMVGTARR